ncbi:hypothetical protein CHCC20335_2088 [Bacillus paralicheniformis]|nr:hypothetical protein CHCC20335_2088 [Bacillus paralicheniformis]
MKRNRLHPLPLSAGIHLNPAMLFWRGLRAYEPMEPSISNLFSLLNFKGEVIS